MKVERTMDEHKLAVNRRRFITGLSAAGITSTLLPGALVAVAQDTGEVTVEMLAEAQRLAGLEFTAEELERVAARLNRPGGRPGVDTLRAANLGNSAQPAIVFNPVPPGMTLPTERRPMRRAESTAAMPSSDEELAFLPVTHLAKLIETRQVKPSELTELYLARLRRHDPALHCVVSYTEEIARRQARQADEEIASGIYRGPLHGIPWGAKDLLAVRGTRTTWGASPYRQQTIDADATVYSRLTEAGAILVAKLSMGALASGDRWFGGRTRNPWNPEQGASGSSAGSGAATAAGLVGFAIGTETRGSIISPSTRNGVTGLRPTFGRVSRYGAMALAWTMDKIGPMCRSAEDCALVFDAIRGPDGRDNTVLDAPFNWDAEADLAGLRVGYLRSSVDEDAVEEDPQNPRRAARERQTVANNRAALDTLRGLGVSLAPFDLPDVPTGAIGFIVATEAAAGFDAPTVNGELDSMRAAPKRAAGPTASAPRASSRRSTTCKPTGCACRSSSRCTRRSATSTCSSAATWG